MLIIPFEARQTRRRGDTETRRIQVKINRAFLRVSVSPRPRVCLAKSDVIGQKRGWRSRQPPSKQLNMPDTKLKVFVPVRLARVVVEHVDAEPAEEEIGCLRRPRVDVDHDQHM